MKKARIYVFGDSIAYGAWDSQGGWPDRLKRKLHQITLSSNHKLKFQLFNLGIGGDNSSSLVKRFQNELKARYRTDWPAVVLIAVGTNDARHAKNSKPLTSVNQYKANLEKIINTTLQYTDKVILVGITPVKDEKQLFKGMFFDNKLLVKYNEVITDLAKKHQLFKVDLSKKFFLTDKELYSRDGVHPNDEGHQIITNLVWQQLEKLLY